MTLLPYEQRAKDFVLRIGIERATRLLELASGRIDRRVRKANEQSFGQFFDWFGHAGPNEHAKDIEQSVSIEHA